MFKHEDVAAFDKPVETLAPMKGGAKADAAERMDSNTSTIFMVLCGLVDSIGTTKLLSLLLLL
jgi:hypothetical protein